MKRLISVILSLALTVTAVYSVLISTVFGAGSSSDTVTVNFENSQKTYYESNSFGTAKSVVDIADVDSAHGSAMQFKQMKVYRAGWDNESAITNWASAFALYDSAKEKIAEYKSGDTLSVSFDLKKNSAVSTKYFTSFKAALVFADEAKLKTDNMGSVNQYVDGSQTALLTSIGCSQDSDWVHYTSEITVPCDGAAAFMLYGAKWFDVCDIYVDNITLTKIEVEVKSADIDFEDTQKTFYENNYLTDKDAVVGIAGSGQAAYGNVMAFHKLKVYRSDFEDNNITQWPSAFVLANNEGTARRSFSKDAQYKITFDMKKNDPVSSNFFSEFKAALIFGSELLTVNGNLGSINPYIENGKAVTLVTVSNSADSDWVTYEAVFTVPCDGGAAFMLYGTNWEDVCDIYVDNISIKPYESKVIDFEGSQSDFYSGNSLTDSEAVVGVASSGDTKHKNVMAFKKLKVYRSDFNDNNITQWPSAFLLCDAAGNKRLTFKKDEQFRITFEMKKNSAVLTGYFSSFKAALIFGGNLETVTGNMGSINTFIENGNNVTLAEVDCSADSDWVKYSVVVKAPCNGAAAFLLYGTEWEENCNIYVDNIEITNKLDGNEVSVECVNADFNGATATVTAYDTDSFSDLVKPFAKNAKFDGWYLDSALTKAARGVIGNTKKVYAKWRTEKDSTVNTYEESNVSYKITETENGYKMTQREIDGVLGEDYFAQYDVVVEQNSVIEKNKSAYFTNAQSYNWNWPATVKIYDNKTLGDFVPNANSAYRIKLKYKTLKTPNRLINLQVRMLGSNGSISYSEENILCSQLVGISTEQATWTTAEGVFYTGSNVGALALMLVSADENSVSEVAVLVDDIEITEVFYTPSVYFETNGGNKINPQQVIVGESIPSVAAPQKKDMLFDGWFTDSECTNPFSESSMPESNVFLYAKWVAPATEAYMLDANFDTCQYINDGSHKNKSDNIISDEAWHINSTADAYEGDGYIVMENKGISNKTAAKYPAVSFLNPDGSSYQVVAGERYKLSFAFRGHYSGQYLHFVTSQQVPTMGVNFGNSKSLAVFQYSSLLVSADLEEWDTYEMYFIPEETGKVYMLALTDIESYLDIDSLKIEKVSESEATIVKYYNADGSFKEQKFGKVGDRLIEPSISNIEGKQFNGWRTQSGKLYTASTFPEEDAELYATWIDAKDLSKVNQNWTKPLTVDFEDSEAAKIFYGTANNSTEPYTGTYYVTGDRENARSGDSYFKLYRVGMWTEQWFRRFRIFNPDSVGNMVYLDPHSVYKVNFWIKIENAGNSALALTTFDSTENLNSYSKSTAIDLIQAEQMGNIGEWVQYESTITTGDEVSTLGMVLSGGWLTALIDDITVTKLETATITFESNGGSKVEPITILTYDYAVAPNFPEKDGYTFVGWFTDKNFTKLFDFNNTMILGNIKLYAKWEKDFVSETYYKDVTEYVEEEIEVDTVPEDAALDEQFNVENTDKIKDAISDNGSFPTLYVILIIVGSLLVMLGVVTVLIIVIKRKQKRGR